MDKPIKIGDLVMVVKPTQCCGDTSSIGEIFRVAWLGVAEGPCNACHCDLPETPAADAFADLDGDCYALYMLKRNRAIHEQLHVPTTLATLINAVTGKKWKVPHTATPSEVRREPRPRRHVD